MGENEKDSVIEEVQDSAGGDLSAAQEPAEGQASGMTALLQYEIEQLNLMLEKKTKECEDNYNRFLMAVADLDNYKKRSEKEKEELINFANERLIKELIGVVDNIERAFGHINTDVDVAALRDGIRLTLDQFLSILKKFGLEQVSAIGENFDPCRHEAICQEERGDCEPGTVIREYQKGYYLKDRLIRPSMVVISKLSDNLFKEENETNTCEGNYTQRHK
ncbi:MAG: nucleotide exchange factor GrpE [Deltaproteobacteria bacterium GWC2_42_11]|nr:MAG: nucleotide exchange factor GrpE [Deltaproteobacteria bacterium GWC2_42_11]HBO83409.1 nucleotide exchange factor GrpE [Deltaproteobacteria bacterium]